MSFRLSHGVYTESDFRKERGRSPGARLQVPAEVAMKAILKLRQMLREGGWAYIGLFVVLGNLPLWVDGRFFQKLLISGWFNVDFIAVGILALFVPRAVSAVLFLMAIAVDFLSAICKTYYVTPREILSNAPEVVDMPSRRIALLGSILLLSLAIAGATFFLPRLRRRLTAATLLIVFAVGCVATDVWQEYRGNPAGVRLILRLEHPQALPVGYLRHELPARESVLSLMRSARTDDAVEAAENGGRAGAPAQSAAQNAYELLKSNAQDSQTLPDFVLILAESWGQSSDAAIRARLVQPYETELAGKFTVLQGSVPFHGPTISGENRELCGSSGGGSIMDAQATELRNCLPDRLRELGFQAIAVHGMRGRFYHRSDWYPRIGFQEIWFQQQLASAGLPDCVGAFTGTCDAAVADWIGRRLAQPDAQPRFVYWVTLNSHLPVPIPPPLNAPASCAGLPRVAGDVAFCSWYRLVLNLHQSVASLAARSVSRPTIYVIVGDHAPPFSDPDLRSGFDQNVVPYAILLPNSMAKTKPAPLQAKAASSAGLQHRGRISPD
jgi:hypothetical protein